MFLAQDLFLRDTARADVTGLISRARHNVLKTNEFDLDKVKFRAEDIVDDEQTKATTKFLIRFHSLWTALEREFSKRGFDALVLDQDNYYNFSSAGLDLKLAKGDFAEFVRVRNSAVARIFSEFAVPADPVAHEHVTRLWGNRRQVFIFDEQRLMMDFTGDPSKPIFERALWNFRRSRLLNRGSFDYYDVTHHDDTMVIVTPNESASNASALLKMYGHIKSSLDARPDSGTWMTLRRELLYAQEWRQGQEAQRKSQLNSERFGKYWSELKSAAVAQELSLAVTDLATIPLQPAGTKTSRTWGIEVETVRADQTSRPGGWRSEFDGSLPDSDDTCDCGCDGCYDGDEHCEDHDNDCYRGNPSSSREFVSPILEHWNSDGLRRLCADLGTDDDEDSAPGIHIHVGAQDLSVIDVANVLLYYSAIEKLFDPILYRKVRNYCKPTTVTTLRYWLAQVRSFRRTNPNDWPDARVVAQGAPDDRYHDVNVHSLYKHGTIEFRAMGAWYDYDHLVRWAWIVREIVNVSKLGIDSREFTRCKSIADVVSLLRKYGQEIPSNALLADVKSADLVLSEC